MFTPQTNYIAFWLVIFVSAVCVWPWICCALIALGGMKNLNWRRIVYAVVLGPFALGDVIKNRW